MKTPHRPHIDTQKLRQVRNVVPPVPKRFKKVKNEERIQEAFQNIPKITNETVAEHREDVLKGARKYKYPLQHSKHRIVVVSSVLLVVAIVGFFVYTSLALYKFQQSSGFLYRVTQVAPFPVAKAGSRYVAYENYLFELRRYEHYYQSQQRVDFNSQSGKDQLASYKPKALEEVMQNAYVRQLADANHVSVSSADLNDALTTLRAQNHSTEQELADVTRKFFGWSLDDLKREIKSELLAQKVATKLDTATAKQAAQVLTQLQSGTDFAVLAAQYSDDTATKAQGGEYANQTITSASTDVPQAVIRALQQLQVGQTSDVIQAGDTLEIVKLLADDNGKLKAAHISFNITPVSTFVAQYEKTHPQHVYISVK